jgi:hypothetical protein
VFAIDKSGMREVREWLRPVHHSWRERSASGD